ncbi:septum formation protein Maf [Candidatus Peregrinibacteria bacterium CG10_big_fil_rev_8_21_14_0_10_49_10]|nr:MAG: septum formation protein Maf [Candidatus Peregrinibacteria bacterium CG10_big_fil_rev_8_21_14_0_10_49_10]
MSTLILASASPQRKTLLEGLGLAFTVCPSAAEESLCTETDPVCRATVLARMKAEDVRVRHPDAWVLGCDTLVVSSSGTLLEKPVDAEDARRMLRLQSASASTVHSTLCLLSPEGESFEGISSSTVHFTTLADEQIEWWISTGEWKDRSGSFQIDGKGQLMIEKLEGDWSGVVGLPVFLLGDLFFQVGFSIQDFGKVDIFAG